MLCVQQVPFQQLQQDFLKPLALWRHTSLIIGVADSVCVVCAFRALPCPVCVVSLQVALGLAIVSLPATFDLPVPSRTPGQEFDYKTVKNW